MATAIGLALGISLAVVEQQFGWNLREAGSFAVLIALLLLGFLILHVLIRVHVSWTLAVPLSYVIVYLLIRAMSPALFQVMSNRMPFINLLTAIIFLICIWQIGVALWPKSRADDPAHNSDASFIAGLNRKVEEREIKAEKRMKRHTIPEVRREAHRIERSLRGVQQELSRDSADLKAVAQALSDIIHRSDNVTQELDRIRTLDRRIRNADWKQLQELNGYYRDLSEEDRGKLKEQILLERRKIVEEHAIFEMAERCEQRQMRLRDALNHASRQCMDGNRSEAARLVEGAVSIEREQNDELNHLRVAERKLLNLTKYKLQMEK